MSNDISNFHDSALADRIVAWAESGIISTPFGVHDVRGLASAEGHAENHINTVLANYEVSGDQVKRGRKARFRRVSRGLYEALGRR